jgi:hypothetical protein
MSSFLQMQQDLQLIIQANLINTDLGALLNLCQRQEVESYDWSFLHEVVTIWSNPMQVTGTIDVTNGSITVTGHGTSFQNANPNMAGWYLQVGPTLAVPVIVASVSSNTLMFLTEPWNQPTMLGTPYSLRQIFYDVSPIIEVTRVRQIFYLEEISRAVLDFMDPARISNGGNPAVYWAKGIWNPTVPLGTQLVGQYPHWSIELWPIATAPFPYLVEGKVGPVDMVANNDQPQLPSSVLENKAAMYACQSIFASSGNPKWLSLAQMYQAIYADELEKAKLADHERMVIKKLSESSMATPGLDVIASHDLFAPTGF